MSFLRDIWLILKPFWQNNSALKIILALFLCVVLELFSVGLSVYLNYWNVDFYNSLQNYNKSLLIEQIVKLLFIVFFMIANSILLYAVSQIFVIKVRAYLTNFYTQSWLYTRAYINETQEYDNPDERISNDIKQFVTILKVLFLGFVGSILTFSFFAWILWHLSGSFSLALYGFEFEIHGYLFWLAVLLATINIYLVIKIGKPLRKLVYDKQKYEAEFRYGLAKIRGNKQAIYDGGLEKSALLKQRHNFVAVVANFYQLTFREMKINIVTGLFAQVYGVIGIFLSLPRYFVKAISFGQVMQINAAFLKVVSPLLFFVYSYDQVAELKANVKRLLELTNQINNANKNNKNTDRIDLAQQEFLKVDDLIIYNSNEPLFKKVSFRLYLNDSIFIKGCVGAGKSSLLQLIKGKDKKIVGSIKYNKVRPNILFLNHKPYFPKDDFKRAIFSSNLDAIPNDNDFKEILKDLGLEHLSKFIDTVFDWNSLLSVGEQQILNFCRLYVDNYDLVILDEATSNIPFEIVEKIYALLKTKSVSYISSGHAKNINKFHNQELCLVKY